ncbi:MAG: hypothetical protein KFB96_02935 [Thiocapsa sp.]|uniref:hypothetical protein n=1 Tax=Thiocapsa sp. TaxID=2024551 RepID=UPI001BCAAED7|nr:hypothetical protein [Thiocapsa sp.]QVL49491.1 MAG: hypothetical protein KFB96_02935 [Thiocapsa sp.]
MTSVANQTLETDERLRDLWRRRATLSQREWEALYSIVHSVLKPKFGELLGQLSVTPEEAIQDFFEDKVFALGDHNSEIDHAGALMVYYKRFLLSLLRDPYRKRRVATPSDADSVAASSDQIDKAGLDQSANADSGDDSFSRQHLEDWIVAQLDPQLPDADKGGQPSETRAVVAQFIGVDLDEVVREAQAFLGGQGRWSHLAKQSDWIQLYLRCHLCPEQADAVALSTLARKYNIPSYHHRAVKLGVTVPLRQDAALAAFCSSYRGQWLISLGIKIDPDHLLEISLALKVLCLVALKSQEPC